MHTSSYVSIAICTKIVLVFSLLILCGCCSTIDIATEINIDPTLLTETPISTASMTIIPTIESREELASSELVETGKLVLIVDSNLVRIDVSCRTQISDCFGELKYLTEEPALYVTPSWSPDGHSILFSSDLEPANDRVLGVFIIDESGGAPKNVAKMGHHPNWSPSGKEIIYATWEGNGHIMRLSLGGDEYVAIERPDSSYPHWSPDGDRIAFIAGGTGPGSIYVFDLSNQKFELIADDAGGYLSWSPDGDYLAYTVKNGRDLDLYFSQVSASEGKEVSVPVDGSVSFPEWSPDGKAIAFVSEDQGNEDIYVAHLDCLSQHTLCVNGVQQITSHSEDETNPIWFPDGNHLAYLAGSSYSWRVELVNLVGGEVQVLIDDLRSARELDGIGW